MKNKYNIRIIRNILIFTLALYLTTSRAQQNKTVADRFMHFLNNYETDSLRNIITDDFQIRRTYTKLVTGKTAFLNEYMAFSKNLQGHYNILKTTQKNNTTVYLVEDQSNYLKCLRIKYPVWQITLVCTSRHQVQSMSIDTTATYKNYVAEVEQKGAAFYTWLKATYPNQSYDTLYTTDGLMEKRLQEFMVKSKQ